MLGYAHPEKQKGYTHERVTLCFYNQILVPLTGIELVTFALRMRCSTD